MLIGHVAYAYLFGVITTYMTNLDTTAASFRMQVDRLNRFIDYRHLRRHTQTRIHEHYSYVWDQTRGFHELQIVRSLPSSIRADVLMHMYSPLLANVPIFAGAERGFIQGLSARVEPSQLPPLEFVIRKDEIGREMYFLLQGKCEVLALDDQTAEVVLPEGSFFGEVALLFSVKRTRSVRSLTPCDVLSLTKRDLAEVMKDYPVEAKKIQQQAKDRMQQLQLQSEDHDNDDDDGDDNPERSSKRFTQPVGGLRRCMSRGESSKAWQRKD